MSSLPIGLELYTLRHEFQADADETLRRVSEMGYDGVEFSIDQMEHYEAEYLRELLDRYKLTCYGYLVMWEDVQKSTLARTLDYNRILGNNMVAIGSAPADLLKTEAGVDEVLEHLGWVHEQCKVEGFTTGYHNHDIEFSSFYQDKSVWEHIFDEMPEDFVLVLDTGNALGGGGEALPIIRKYQGRLPILHAKPYSLEDKYATMIGEDSIPWPEVIKTCKEIGGTQVLIVEYGNSIKYKPYESSELCLRELQKLN